MIGLAGLALVVPWGFMILMVVRDIALYPSLQLWLTDSQLFFDAYRQVTEEPEAWWWSSQLMVWVVGGVLLFHREGGRRRFATTPYVWLGRCGPHRRRPRSPAT